MHKRSFTLVELMIVISIIGLLTAIAIPTVITARLTANDSAARASLKSIANAFESYAATNSGLYPASDAVLASATPPYLFTTYDGLVTGGYTYSVMASSDGYTISAEPKKYKTGSVTKYTIQTGGVFSTVP